MSNEFWRGKRIEDLDKQQWEALCDGCGQCCRIKLQDEDTAVIGVTDVVCTLLDTQTCRCTDYENRAARVSDCIDMRDVVIAHLHWLPESCAYRRVAQGRDLPRWHYLVCGDRNRVHELGQSIRGVVQSEREVGTTEAVDYESRVIKWIQPDGRRV